MKKVGILLLSVMLASCQFAIIPGSPKPPEVLAELPAYSSISKIWAVVSSLPYVESGYEIIDPRETIIYGGDCADVSGLFIALCRKVDIDAVMIGYTVRKGMDHAIVQIGDEYYEPQVYGMYYEARPTNITKIWTLEDYLLRVRPIE